MCAAPALSLLAESVKAKELLYFPKADVCLLAGAPAATCWQRMMRQGRSGLPILRLGAGPVALSQPVLTPLASAAIDAAEPLPRWAAELGVCSL